MTVKEASNLIAVELKNRYPSSEIESFIFLIFHHFMNFRWGELFLKADTFVSQSIELQIYNIIAQLKQHKPIQYILGETEFYGLSFFVDESVLIPRPETEELVQWILSDIPVFHPVILDIGTGSGCIPVALAKNSPAARLLGVDISEAALVTAKRNAQKNGVDVEFIKMDILSENFPDIGDLDIIVSNPPYVTNAQKEEMEANVTDYEPHLALFVPDKDPLIFYRAISKFALRFLKSAGCMYFEINETLADETVATVQEFGFTTELRKDLNNKYRMLKAVRI